MCPAKRNICQMSKKTVISVYNLVSFTMQRQMRMWYLLTVYVYLCIDIVSGQGRLLAPAGRSSMWRMGYGTPINNNDNALSCGGIKHRWAVNKGKCGVCGDPWDSKPRANEAGGMYANEIIAGVYQSGDLLEAVVDIANADGGYFEFRLCANNNFTSPVKAECFESGLLTLEDGISTRFDAIHTGYNKVLLMIPDDIVCDQCVLQWKYRTADQYGCETNIDGKQLCGFGYGEMQTEYFACSDIAIYADSNSVEKFKSLLGDSQPSPLLHSDGTQSVQSRTKRRAQLGPTQGSSARYNPTLTNEIDLRLQSRDRYKPTVPESQSHGQWSLSTMDNTNNPNELAGRTRRRTHLPPEIPEGIAFGNPHLNGLVSPKTHSTGTVRSSFNLRRNGIMVHNNEPTVKKQTASRPNGIPIPNIPFNPIGDLFNTQTNSVQSVIVQPEPSLTHAREPSVRAIIRPVAKMTVTTVKVSKPSASITANSLQQQPSLISAQLDARMHRNFIDPLSPFLQPDIASNTQKILSRSNYKPTKKCMHCPFDQCLDDKLRIDHLFPGLFDSPTQFFECKRFERVFTLGNYDVVQEGLPSCDHPRFKRQLIGPQFDDDDIGCCGTRPQVILPLTVEAENDTFSVVQLGDAKKQFIVQGICGKSNTSTCTICAAENNFQWVLVYDPRVNTNPPVSFVPVKFPHYCRCYNYMQLKG